ncbi:MAG: sugar transferase [Bradymonadales bacterium]|nr:sugar transferase [Bradymonadales bacterium]
MVSDIDRAEEQSSLEARDERNPVKHRWYLKRPADILFALGILLLLFPFLLLIALLIKLDSQGPVLYPCSRVGRGGRTFRFYKFRSMHENTSGQLKAIMESSPHISGEYLAYHKIRRDPRVTRMGHFLRRFSLDELPQVINVLKGDMSLIGPRPYLIEELPELEEKARIILSIRPGLTGLWQVSGRNRLSFERRIELDSYYALHWSLKLDITILARTLPVVIKGEGAY